MAQIHDGALGVGLAMLGLVQVCPRRAAAHKSLEFGIKCSKNPVFRLAAHSRCPYIYAYR